MEMDCNLKKLGQLFQVIIVMSQKNDHLKPFIVRSTLENSLDIFLLV